MLSLAFLTAANLTGCQTARPATPTEELCAHIWITEKGEGALTFEEDRLTLRVRQGENAVLLQGEYLADDHTLTILSGDYGNVVMEYTLCEDRLTLRWYDKDAVFVKKPEPQPSVQVSKE